MKYKTKIYAPSYKKQNKYFIPNNVQSHLWLFLRPIYLKEMMAKIEPAW